MDNILLRLVSPAYTVRQLGMAGLGTVNSANFSQVFPGERKKLVGDFATFFLLELGCRGKRKRGAARIGLAPNLRQISCGVTSINGSWLR
jgi:hypothetical protein